MNIVTGFPLNWKVRDLIGQGILLMVREKKICIVQIVYFVEKMKMHIQCMLMGMESQGISFLKLSGNPVY